MTTGKTLALTRRNFVGKVMSLLFNMLSRLVITFLPRSKRLLINYAAKSLQLCPTLCDPIDGSPPGSPVPGILQARTLKWAAISFSDAWNWKVKVKLLSRVQLFVTPWTAARQASFVHHQLPEITQTHVHRVSDAIQPSHPLSSPSAHAFNLSQNQGLFKWVLHIRLPKYWSFSFSITPSQWIFRIFRTDFL